MLLKSAKPIVSAKALIIFLVSFAIGSLYAQILPTLSIYLVLQFNSKPSYLGLFFVCLAISAIIVSQIIGRISDRGLSRKKLIVIGMLAGAMACIGFAFSINFIMALGVGVAVFSLAGITMPQIMALGREFANSNLPAKNVPLFNAILRASFALAWIAGPPIGFHLQHTFGPERHYLLLSIAYFAVALFVFFFLPEKSITSNAKAIFTTLKIPFNLKLGFIACALLFSVNQSYLIALPQLFVTHLGIATYKAGYVMGIAAALEIPIMVLGGWIGAKMPLLPLLRVGAIAGAFLYFGVWLANGFWHLVALQIFNALFVGLIAGLGMTWFQDQLPNHTGTASSLFTNAINVGNIIGALIIAVVASALGYHQMYLVNCIVALLALGLLLLCKK